MLNSSLDGLATIGDRSLLEQPRRALLISRTPRRPAPGTPWVRSLVESVRQSVNAGEMIITGVGRDPYELALRETQRQRGATVVVLGEPPSGNDDEAWRELLPERHLIVWREPEQTTTTKPGRKRNDETRLRARDLLIGQLADRAWEITIRRGGIMSKVAEDLRRRNGPVETAAVRDQRGRGVEGQPGRRSVGEGESGRARISPSTGSGRIRGTQSPDHLIAQSLNTHLSHYTREPDGAWPGESRGAYLDWLATGPLDDRRDAFAALRRILEEGCIRGSGRLMPNREPMVSLTAASASEVASLRRFRASLHRWDFRPYGLAIRRDILEGLGARPVRYLPGAELKRLTADERRFAQKHEPPRTDWSREKEWRLAGELRLRNVPPEALVVLAPTHEEACALAHQQGYGVYVVGDSEGCVRAKGKD